MLRSRTRASEFWIGAALPWPGFAAVAAGAWAAGRTAPFAVEALAVVVLGATAALATFSWRRRRWRAYGMLASCALAGAAAIVALVR